MKLLFMCILAISSTEVMMLMDRLDHTLELAALLEL